MNREGKLVRFSRKVDADDYVTMAAAADGGRMWSARGPRGEVFVH
jgi:hypothetical protein